MGKADRKNGAKPRGGLGKTKIFLLARSFARFFTASRSFRSSSLTESLVQATQEDWKKELLRALTRTVWPG